jgi:hypothetical protein
MSERKDLLRRVTEENGLNAEVIYKALQDTLYLGLVDWGSHRAFIERIVSDPTDRDVYTLISNSHVILRPLEDWLEVEQNWILYERESITLLEWVERSDRCYQVYNFILLIKLY